MPCRKESFLLLEQAVTVGTGEVDSLVARIGEALQLNGHRAPTSCSMAYGGVLKPAAGPRPPSSAAAMCSCVRGRSTPYPVCTPRAAGRCHHRRCPGGNKQLCGRGWLRRKEEGGEEDEDDPHQLLQELLLSGNLIKEAVRRLHLAGATERSAEPAETTVQ
ncbi:GSK-3-binding protein FRAT2 [Gastrophryne carolinensis]